MRKINTLLRPASHGFLPSTGILILRIAAGYFMLVHHGWPKLQSFNERSDSFFDFLGLGPTISLILALGAEVVCSICLMLGLGTRLILIPLMILSIVIAFVVHGEDPIKEKELILMYFATYVALFLTGPGRYSLDSLLFSGNK